MNADEPLLPWPLNTRVAQLALFGLVPALLLLAFSSWQHMADYVEHDPGYCAQCHASRDQYVVWDQDAHHRVACQKCHQQTVQEAAAMLQAYVEGGGAARNGKKKLIHSAWVEDTTCLHCHGPRGSSKVSMANSPAHLVHLELPKVGCLTCHARGIHRRSEPETSCQKCHDEKAGKGCASDGNCTACHTFVGGADSLLPSRNTCEGCHQITGVGKSAHGTDPHMGNLECSVCHRPHVPSGPKVVACNSCHNATANECFHGSPGHAGCIDCHKPHMWDARGVNCRSCHDGAHERAAGDNCRQCHFVRARGRGL